MTAALYGIANCDQVKTARDWLAARHIDYQFYDFKKTPIDAVQVERWLKQLGSQRLINRSSTSWRQLSEQQRAICAAETDATIALLIDRPTLIKRPLLEYRDQTHCGFDATLYQQLFKTE